MPTISGQGLYWCAADVNTQNSEPYSNAVTSEIEGGSYASISNFLTYPFSPAIADQYTSNTGRALGIRAEYNLGMANNGYPSAPWSKSQATPFIKNQTWKYSNMTTNGFQPGKPYQVTFDYPTNHTNGFYVGSALHPANMINTCGAIGFTKPVASSFGKGGN